MFGKIITAVVTPFDELGNVDVERFKKLLLHVCLLHAKYIVNFRQNASKWDFGNIFGNIPLLCALIGVCDPIYESCVQVL